MKRSVSRGGGGGVGGLHIFVAPLPSSVLRPALRCGPFNWTLHVVKIVGPHLPVILGNNQKVVNMSIKGHR